MHIAAISIHLHGDTTPIQGAIDMLIIHTALETIHGGRMHMLACDPQIHALPLWQLQTDVPGRVR